MPVSLQAKSWPVWWIPMLATEMGRGAVAVTLLLCLAACDTPASPEAARSSPTPTISAGPTSPEPATRPPTEKPALRLFLDAEGAARRRVERAIRDLKSVSLWLRLTRHLFILRIETRSGKRVPEDGHLADAGLAVHVDPMGAGLFCYIRMWPAALDRDLANQRVYYSEGRLGFVPPSDRIFWASILGHELGHCQGRREVTPEDVALEWEKRVRDLLTRRI